MKKLIPFNKPLVLGTEKKYIEQAFLKNSFCGDNFFNKKCEFFLENYLGAKRALLMSSCTQALEVAALLLNIQPDDEVIMPSYTFVSTANAFVLRGATIVFVDVDPISMNMSLDDVERAITNKTKAIVPVHYAGMCCDMDKLMQIAHAHNIFVVEDAAQSISSSWNGKKLGSFGHLACFSFHETKNIHCGEGGALIINDINLVDRAEIIREKGTNRKQFIHGLVDKYTWVDIGVSGLMSELQAAFLFAQLESLELVCQHRLNLFNKYSSALESAFKTIKPTQGSSHNGHIFALFAQSHEERNYIIKKLKEKNIVATFHYIPLTKTPYADKNKKHRSLDIAAIDLSSRIVRLPMFFDMNVEDVDFVVNSIESIR